MAHADCPHLLRLHSIRSWIQRPLALTDNQWQLTF